MGRDGRAISKIMSEPDNSIPQENDEYILNAVKQGMKEALRGEILTEEEFWKAVHEDDDDEYIRQSIKEGMKEALRGEGLPVKDFWNSLREDDN